MMMKKKKICMNFIEFKQHYNIMWVQSLNKHKLNNINIKLNNINIKQTY